jgi:5'(3')-deoxyribonucleotidase
MKKQKLIYIDMDDVLCDYSSAYKDVVNQSPGIDFPQSLPGFFEKLLPLDGVIKSFKFLSAVMEAYILSAPSVYNPLCYTEKRLWVEEHLG